MTMLENSPSRFEDSCADSSLVVGSRTGYGASKEIIQLQTQVQQLQEQMATMRRPLTSAWASEEPLSSRIPMRPTRPLPP